MDFKGKKKSDMDPTYKKAKMGVLGNLHDLMSKSLAGDMKGMKKVTVASNDQEGLEHGLDKAKEMLNSKLGAGASDESDDAEADEAKEGAEGGLEMAEDVADHEIAEGDMTPEEIDEMIQHLEMKKAALKK